MTQTRKKRLLWTLCLAALALFAAAMVWLHYQQLCATGRGEDPYTSDLGQHLHFAQSGLIYSATSLLIGPAYAAGGKLGIALLLAVFHLAAVVVFAWGLKAALPEWSLPARLLASFVVNLAQAVYIPRGGYWYQGTITGTIYHNTTYIMLAPFALLAVLWFYRAWQGIDGRVDLRTWLIYTAFLTAATAFKANLIFAFAPALLVLLIADFIRTRAKNIGNEVLMGCSVFPGVGLCILEANVLFTEEGSGLRLIFTTEFDRHALLWGVFNEAALLGLLRSLPFVAAVALLLVIIAVLAVLVSWLLRSAAKGDVAKSKLFLHQKEELREQQDMQVLVGHEGRTLSVLRPSGIGDFDGVRLNVVTEGEFIENGVAIRIARVEGGKIVVKAIKS